MLCNSSRKIVLHLTTVHPRYDTRIFYKECISLKNAGYDVSLVVADGEGDEIKNNIRIYGISKPNGRINRIFKGTRAVFKKAVEIDADIYHLHDPELIPIGIKLKKIGKIVIFDVHEDLPKQILSKSYLKGWQQKLLSAVLKFYEINTCKKFNAIVTATSFLKDKFLKINPSTVNINNYPLCAELVNSLRWEDKKNEICYIGAVSKVRGIKEVLKAMKFTRNVKLTLAGKFTEKDTEEEVKSYHEWNRVNELGIVNREQVKNILKTSMAGVVTFLPVPNHVNSQPNKMFEYMSAGIPVIASNFPLWKEIIEGNRCGICVDPLNPKEIADAIEFIVNNRNKAEMMGKNGRRAVMEKYNWDIEEKKLLKLYKGFATE